MRTRRILWTVMTATTVGILSITAATAESNRGWHTDPAAAQAEAARLNVPLLLHFYAEWCGPCRKMERETLETGELLSQLGRTLVAVRVDGDRHQNLVEKYNIRALPSDVIVEPSGRVLARSDGYQPRDRYLAQLARAQADFSRTNPGTLAGASPPAGMAPPGTGSGIAVPTDVAPALSPREPAEVQVTSSPRRAENAVGLEGYSPVALSQRRKWRKGNPELSAEHEGIVYHLASAEELSEFQRNPDRYAPRLLGCDPVVLAESNRAVFGDIRYGAYYDGALYLFCNRDNRERFKADPAQYLQTRQALNVEEVHGQSRK